MSKKQAKTENTSIVVAGRVFDEEGVEVPEPPPRLDPPVEHLEPKEPDYYCNHRKTVKVEIDGEIVRRYSGYCRRRAGYRTDHPGIGRCYRTQGRPLIHGKQSKVLKQIRARTEDDFWERTAYYLSGAGADESESLKVVLAEMAAATEDIVVAARGKDTAAAQANVIRILETRAKTLTTWKKLQEDKGISLERWTQLTKRLEETYRTSITYVLMQKHAMTKTDAVVTVDAIYQHARRLWEEDEARMKARKRPSWQ